MLLLLQLLSVKKTVYSQYITVYSQRVWVFLYGREAILMCAASKYFWI